MVPIAGARAGKARLRCLNMSFAGIVSKAGTRDKMLKRRCHKPKRLRLFGALILGAHEAHSAGHFQL